MAAVSALALANVLRSRQLMPAKSAWPGGIVTFRASRRLSSAIWACLPHSWGPLLSATFPSPWGSEGQWDCPGTGTDAGEDRHLIRSIFILLPRPAPLPSESCLLLPSEMGPGQPSTMVRPSAVDSPCEKTQSQLVPPLSAQACVTRIKIPLSTVSSFPLKQATIEWPNRGTLPFQALSSPQAA